MIPAASLPQASVPVDRVHDEGSFVLIEEYVTNLPSGDQVVRVAVELLLEVTTQVWWATVQDLGVAAAGSSPADAALTAMRAAVALM